MRSHYNSEIDIEKGIAQRLPEYVKGRHVLVITEQTSYKLIASILKEVSHAPHFLGKGTSLNMHTLGSEPCDVYLGAGGGTAIDIAKYLGYVKKKPVIALPTILSTNVFTTVKVCCKEVVRSVGARGSIDGKIPDTTLIDLELIGKAEKRYNRSGIGDILSIYTADWEWKIAKEKRRALPDFHFSDDPYDPVIAYVALSLLRSLQESLTEIRDATPEGLCALAKLMIYSGYVTNMYGSGRPESGAEHLFASTVVNTYPERRFLHGELVSLGTLLMTHLQERDVTYVADIIRSAGLPTSLQTIGLTVDEVIHALSIAKEDRHDRYTVLHHRNVGVKESGLTVDFLISRGYLVPWR